MEFKIEITTVNGEEMIKYYVDGEQVDSETYDELLEQDTIECDCEREIMEEALHIVHEDEDVVDFLIDGCADVLDDLDIDYCEDCFGDLINVVGKSMIPVFVLGYLHGTGIYE